MARPLGMRIKPKTYQKGHPANGYYSLALAIIIIITVTTVTLTHVPRVAC